MIRARLRGVRVLLVAEDAEGRRLHAAALAAIGAEVMPVERAPAALERAEKRAPHVLVVVEARAGGEARALFAALRAKHALETLPAVLVAAGGAREETGFAAVLAKPTREGELQEAVYVAAFARA